MKTMPQRWVRTVCAGALATAIAAPAATLHAEVAVDARELAPVLRAGDATAVEARLAELEAAEARTREGWLAQSRSFYALGIAAAEDPAIGAALAEWRRASPQAWRAEMIEGWRLLSYGLPPRADDRSFDTVEFWSQPEPGLVASARAAFERAASLAPASSEPGAALIAVQVLERAPIPERERTFAAACRVDRVCETARALLLTALEPQFGGSVETLLNVARASAAAHPERPSIGLLVGIAHRKVALAVGDPEAYFRRIDVFEEAERAYARHLAAYPEAIRHRNEYARILCWASRRESARREFERIGDAYSAPAWKSDFAQFRKRREWALAGAEQALPAALAP